MNGGNAVAGSRQTPGLASQGYGYAPQHAVAMSQAGGHDAGGYQNQAFYAQLGGQQGLDATGGLNQMASMYAAAAGMPAGTSAGAQMAMGSGQQVMMGSDSETLYNLMIDLFSPSHREAALAELSRRRDHNPDLGVALWNAYGVMTILYQEIIIIYPLLNPPALTMAVSNRACNSLALLQLVATHEQTRMQLLKANVPQLLYPFLSTTSRNKQYDNLRLTSLGVIGALVKYDNHEVISFFVATEFLPLCLKIMDIGSELCKV
ncbi:RNA-binding protein, CCR4-NOT complex subunit Rcd1, partial [Linderina macrospora]